MEEFEKRAYEAAKEAVKQIVAFVLEIIENDPDRFEKLCEELDNIPDIDLIKDLIKKDPEAIDVERVLVEAFTECGMLPPEETVTSSEETDVN